MTTLTTDQARRHFIHQLKVTPEKFHITGKYFGVIDGKQCACAMGIAHLSMGSVQKSYYRDSGLTMSDNVVEAENNMFDFYNDKNAAYVYQHIIRMNDTRSRSFKFIARWLEIVWGIRD